MPAPFHLTLTAARWRPSLLPPPAALSSPSHLRFICSRRILGPSRHLDPQGLVDVEPHLTSHSETSPHPPTISSPPNGRPSSPSHLRVGDSAPHSPHGQCSLQSDLDRVEQPHPLAAKGHSRDEGRPQDFSSPFHHADVVDEGVAKGGEQRRSLSVEW